MKTITFKSIQSNFRKEVLGLKRNTIRKFDTQDIREEILSEWIDDNLNLLNIEIVNKDNPGETFTRQVTDVTRWEEYYIISW